MRGNEVFPKENDPEKKGRGGMALVHYFFNYNRWEYRQEVGADRGRDCILEYIAEDEWQNGQLSGQVKGTTIINSYRLKTEDCFSFPLEKKTINYALHSKNAFLLLLCDLIEEKVYYLPIQDYFIDDQSLYERLEKETDKMSLRIPTSNIVKRDDDHALVMLTKASYVFKDGRVIKYEG